MNERDDWGHDPTVQRTRRYFSRMEAMDAGLLDRSGISAFDLRLRPARKLRFELFENTCSRAVGKGLRLDERLGLELFELCQDMAFKKTGLPVVSDKTPQNPELLSLVREGLK